LLSAFSLTEIAGYTGFSSQSAMPNAFRNQFGYLPGNLGVAYRRWDVSRKPSLYPKALVTLCQRDDRAFQDRYWGVKSTSQQWCHRLDHFGGQIQPVGGGEYCCW